jgi:hypothetical protein
VYISNLFCSVKLIIHTTIKTWTAILWKICHQPLATLLFEECSSYQNLVLKHISQDVIFNCQWTNLCKQTEEIEWKPTPITVKKQKQKKHMVQLQGPFSYHCLFIVKTIINWLCLSLKK